MPGRIEAVGIVHHHADLKGAGRRVGLPGHEIDLPGPLPLGVGVDAHLGLLALGQKAHVALGHVEVDAHGGHVDDIRHGIALAHELPGIDMEFVDHPVQGRGHRAVAEIHFGLSQTGPGRGQFIVRLIELLFGQHALGVKLASAPRLILGQAQARTRTLQRSAQ
jgi:hypothetical protein